MGDGLAAEVSSAVAGALTGSIIGGAPGAILGAVLPPILVRFSAAAEARQRNVESVIEVAAEIAGLTGDELADWMGADVRRMSFFQDVVASAWSTFDDDKLRTLAAVFGAVVDDDALLDLDQLVVRALREFEPAHVAVLRVVVEEQCPTQGNRPAGAWLVPQLAERLDNLAIGMPALVASLSRTGCIETTGGTYADQGASVWVATTFGRRCHEVLGGGA